MHSLDPYVPGTSPVHRADARVKLAVAAVYTVAVLAVPASRPDRLTGFVVALAVATAAARLPVRTVAARAVPVAGLIGLASLGLLFEGSVAGAVSMSAKAALCTWCALLVSATTRFTHVLAGLRAVRVPVPLVSVAGLAHRLVFVALEEVLRTATAYRCRVPQAGLAARIRHVARLSGVLCRRAMERTDRVERGLQARAFDGALRVLPLPPLRARDLCAGAVAVAALLLLEVVAYR